MDTAQDPTPQPPESVESPATPPQLPQNAPSSQPPTVPEKDRPYTPLEKKFGCAGAVIFCLGLALMIGRCGGNDSENQSVEYKMACIDAKMGVDEDAPEVAEFKILIEKLAKRFDTGKSQIAAATIVVVESLEEEGIRATHLEMMKAAEKASSGEGYKGLGLSGPDGYNHILAMIATLMITEN